MRRLILLLVCPMAVAAWLVPAPARAAEVPVDYRPPVEAPVVDPFRPPQEPWGPGNRGVDYAVPAGTPVKAAASGEVAFAGPVGGDLHVVVLHGDGLRTSYSFLASVAVRRHDAVEAGATVGTAGGPVHFGVRDGDRYVDPLAVLGGRTRVQLLPDGPVEAPSEAVERSHLARLVRRLPRRVAAPAAEWLVERAPASWRGWLHYGTELATPASLRAAAAVADWDAQRRRCTAIEVETAPLAERRVAVLVGGLGSTAEEAAVHDVDTHTLGYAPGDVVRFSYRGGTTTEQAYTAPDTVTDLRVSGARLRAVVASLAARRPDVPVDVVGHSQGGVVARIAVLEGAPAAVVVTLGAPHQGADLATGAAMLTARGVLAGAPSVLQLAETSSLMQELGARPLPASTRVLSVAARGDLVVPPLRSRLAGAGNVTVTLPPPFATVHRRLPGSSQATRELALALAGRPPTCQTLADVVTDHLVATTTSLAEDALGATLTLATPNLRQ